jgi:hypothetical protein
MYLTMPAVVPAVRPLNCRDQVGSNVGLQDGERQIARDDQQLAVQRAVVQLANFMKSLKWKRLRAVGPLSPTAGCPGVEGCQCAQGR